MVISSQFILLLLTLSCCGCSEYLNLRKSEQSQNIDSENKATYKQYIPKKIYTYLYFPNNGYYEAVNISKPYRTQRSETLNKIASEIEGPKSSLRSSLSENTKNYGKSFNTESGYNTKEGYNKNLKYSKGIKDSYERHHKLGDEISEKERKSLNNEDQKDYESNDKEEEEKENGEDYNAKKHHKKGSRSKGYHNIFMKDEYKKDHTFYDHSDEQGHYSKNGSQTSKYENDENKLTKGNYNDAGNQSHFKKKQSLQDKKEYIKADDKYKKESKQESHDDHGGENDHYKNGKSSYNVAIKHTV